MAVGFDARRIDYLWTNIYRDMNWLGQGGLVLSAISGIDIALWELKAKTLGVPLYELLWRSLSNEDRALCQLLVY